MEAIKPGDVVRLKSGGPLMTVSGIGDYSLGATGNAEALCRWFDGKEVKEKEFVLHLLKKEE